MKFDSNGNLIESGNKFNPKQRGLIAEALELVLILKDTEDPEFINRLVEISESIGKDTSEWVVFGYDGSIAGNFIISHIGFPTPHSLGVLQITEYPSNLPIEEGGYIGTLEEGWVEVKKADTIPTHFNSKLLDIECAYCGVNIGEGVNGQHIEGCIYE
tara:strand:+ start:2074 stop:2547 length:474 start_codon:yes stop_codon:yes gene_type:complete